MDRNVPGEHDTHREMLIKQNQNILWECVCFNKSSDKTQGTSPNLPARQVSVKSLPGFMPACQPSSLAVCPAVCWGDKMPGLQIPQCSGSLLNKVPQHWGTLGLPAVHHKARLAINLKDCLPREGQERCLRGTYVTEAVNKGWGGVRSVSTFFSARLRLNSFCAGEDRAAEPLFCHMVGLY